MPKTLQFRRGSTTSLAIITGAVGELFVDTTKNTVVVHDGATTGGTALVTETTTQTLSNKTLAGTRESIFTITDTAAFEVNPANGGIQTITLGASRTPKATSFTSGQSVTLLVDDGSAYSITWTDTTWGTSGVTWVGGTAPVLATTGFTVLEFWKVGTQVYGALVGNVT